MYLNTLFFHFFPKLLLPPSQSMSFLFGRSVIVIIPSFFFFEISLHSCSLFKCFIFASFTHKHKHSNQFVTWNEYLYTILLYFSRSLSPPSSILSRFSLYLISFYLKRSSFFPILLSHCTVIVSFRFLLLNIFVFLYVLLGASTFLPHYFAYVFCRCCFLLSRYIPYRNLLNDISMLSSNLLLSRSESIIRK